MKRSVTLSIALCGLSALTAQNTAGWRDVTLSEAGTLEKTIMDDRFRIDSLVVRGPVNAADFTTMWEGTVYGRLSAVNLEYAEPEDGEIPECAFFGVPMINGTNCGMSKLRSIILPEGLTRIGSMAFPSTMLEEAVIPDGCTLEGTSHFGYCSRLRRVHLPDDLETLPANIFEACKVLEDVHMPSVTAIADSAFRNSGFIITGLPEGLETIGTRAFAGCRFAETLVIPATVTRLGTYCFDGCGSVSAVYCLAAIPPQCDLRASGKSPFGVLSNCDTHALSDVPLHVPVGSGEAYRRHDSWGMFRNIIEDADMPQASVEAIAPHSDPADDTVYDLTGRKTAAPAEGRLYIRGGRKYVHRSGTCIP